MSKITFLFVLFLIAFGYLFNRYSQLFLTNDILLIAQWIWCFIGLIVFRSEKQNTLNNIKNKKYVLWFIFIFLCSSLGPLFEYNQPILNTLISQRANYSIGVLLIYLYIHPTEEEIFTALRKLAMLSVALFIYSIFDPVFFIDPEKIESRLSSGSNDIGASSFIPGFMILVVYFYYIAHKLVIRTKNSFKNILFFLILFVIIFLIQNRQTILITFPIFLFTLYKMRSQYNRIISIFVITTGIFVFGSYGLYILEGLVEESNSQLGDKDYNRWQALEVFFVEWEFNLFHLFFGHGVGSVNSEYTKKLSDLAELRGAYIQDIGFLGSMFFYGIPFVLLNYYLIFKGFFKKSMPYYLKFWTFGLIILPIFQNWGMMNNDSAVLFATLFYLILYSNKYREYNFKNGNIYHYNKLQ